MAKAAAEAEEEDGEDGEKQAQNPEERPPFP